ncbi:MAG: IgGFc-binding protein [Deltaproteobacteria bacterium]|nr:IgGFc-binding protein [Deltaproteobacteria bacterium]
MQRVMCLAAGLGLAAAVLCGCKEEDTNKDGDFDWVWDGNPDEWRCMYEGQMRCDGNVYEVCQRDEEFLVSVRRDCTAEGLVCLEDPPVGCAECIPRTLGCEGQYIVECNEEPPIEWVRIDWCDPDLGDICVNGACRNGCEYAESLHSNVGCDYWALDLDNAMIHFGLDASSQQFAVAVSNTSPLEAIVTVTRNDAAFGEEPDIYEVDQVRVPSDDLYVFLLDRLEVDGSTIFGLNDGTGTALTTNAYRLQSTAPIVAYQFNPLDNVEVFSNDASILIPTTALRNEYIVLSWPQTIANTPENPDTDMNNDLRAFLTIVGTEALTNVHIDLPFNDTMYVLGDGGTIPAMTAGDSLDITLGAYEVLNLESDGFMADFTGTVVSADKPVAVFTGSEASDVPHFPNLSSRLCCADHLEQQVYPSGTQGRNFVAGITPMRTAAVRAAGGSVSVPEDGEKEYFRIMAMEDETTIQTTLPAPDNQFILGSGYYEDVMSKKDFLISADKPISVGQFVASQQVTGITNELPGGDPAFIYISPVEQWREEYIFLTPSQYAFDFIIILHTPTTTILLDGNPLWATCDTLDVEDELESMGEYSVTRCQLSFPEIEESETPPHNIIDGEQNDGVHSIVADMPVGLVVYGFDNFVSYGYPGGTDLQLID